MRVLKHLLALLKETFSFARDHKIWWIAPLLIILLLITFFIVAGSAVAPFIYPLF